MSTIYELALNSLAVQIDKATKAAYQQLMGLINSGVRPREALQTIYLSFSKGSYNDVLVALLAKSFTKLLQQPFTSQQMLNYKVGKVSLSTKLYANAQKVSNEVETTLNSYSKAFVNLNKLSLSLYEGYAFNPKEILATMSDPLPMYLKNAINGDLERELAKLSASGLATDPLRAAYSTYLQKLESGLGEKAKQKALKVAAEEKMRYYATRISTQELARAYNKNMANRIKGDPNQYVEVRYSGSHKSDICNLYGDVDRFGQGQGVYPKDQAPIPPYHIFCRCRLISLVNKKTEDTPTADDQAQIDYLNGLSDEEKRALIPTASMREALANGVDPTELLNSKTPAEYQIQTIGSL
jgi:hypothetical protein